MRNKVVQSPVSLGTMRFKTVLERVTASGTVTAYALKVYRNCHQIERPSG